MAVVLLLNTRLRAREEGEMSIFDCTKCGKRYVTSVGFEKHKCITDIDIKVIIAERDRYKAGLDDAMHLLMNHNHHADPEWVSGYDDLCNRYSKIKEG
jgi:hypothetical protein